MDQNNIVNQPSISSQQKEHEASNLMTVNQRPPATQKVTKIKLSTKTWNKDSYGLFDYQAKDDQYEKHADYIEETTFIVRNNKNCQTMFLKDLSELKPAHQSGDQQRLHCPYFQIKEEFTVLGELIVDRTRKSPSFKLKLHKPPESATKSQIDLPVRHSNNSKRLIPFILADGSVPKSQGYPLQPGNIIKFGRVEYLVLESFNGKNTSSYRDSAYLDEGDNIFDVMKQRELMPPIPQNEDKDNLNCKICLCNEETEEDPLISPCKCKGYCGLIHTNCLKTWINNKVKKETSGLAVSYNFTKFECEICKAPFPKMIRTQVEEVEMMKIDKPQKPYIMLQSLDPLNNQLPTHQVNSAMNEKQKLLHVISTDDKCPIRIGRANQCQIRLMDISVSRRHAQIKLIDGDFYIKDTEAKFGTLVEWSSTSSGPKGDIININRKKPLKIQLGRTSYEFTVEDISQDIDTQ